MPDEPEVTGVLALILLTSAGPAPNGVTNYAGIDATPAVLARLLAVIGVAVLGQLILISGSADAVTSPSSRP